MMQRLFSLHWKRRPVLLLLRPLHVGRRWYVDVSASAVMRVLRESYTNQIRKRSFPQNNNDDDEDNLKGKSQGSITASSKQRLTYLSQFQNNTLCFSWSECVEVLRMCVVDNVIHESEWYMIANPLVLTVAFRVDSELRALRVHSASIPPVNCPEEYVWDAMTARERVTLLAEVAVLLSHQQHSSTNVLHFTFTQINNWRREYQEAETPLDERDLYASLQHLSKHAEQIVASGPFWSLTSTDDSNLHALYRILQPFLPALEAVYSLQLDVAGNTHHWNEGRCDTRGAKLSAMVSLDLLRDTIPILQIFSRVLPDVIRREMSDGIAIATTSVKECNTELLISKQVGGKSRLAWLRLCLQVERCGQLCHSLTTLPRAILEESAVHTSVRSLLEETLSGIHHVAQHINTWRNHELCSGADTCLDEIVAGFVCTTLRQLGNLPFCKCLFGSWCDEKNSLAKRWDECVQALLRVYMGIPQKEYNSETWCSVAQSASNVVSVRRMQYFCNASTLAYVSFPTSVFAEFLLRQNSLLIPRKRLGHVSLEFLAWCIHLGGEQMITSSAEESLEDGLILRTTCAIHAHAAAAATETTSLSEDAVSFGWLTLLASTASCASKLTRLAGDKKEWRQFEKEMMAQLQLIGSLCYAAIFGSSRIERNGSWASTQRITHDGQVYSRSSSMATHDIVARHSAIHIAFQNLLQQDSRSSQIGVSNSLSQRLGTEKNIKRHERAMIVSYSLVLRVVIILSYHADTLFRHFSFTRQMAERLLSLPVKQAANVLHFEFRRISMDGMDSFLHLGFCEMDDWCAESGERNHTVPQPLYDTSQLNGGVALSALFMAYHLVLRFKYHKHILQRSQRSIEEQTRREKTNMSWRLELIGECITALELLGRETMEPSIDGASTTPSEVLDLGEEDTSSGDAAPKDRDCFASTLTRHQARAILEVLGYAILDSTEHLLRLDPEKHVCVRRAAAVVVSRALEANTNATPDKAGEHCVSADVSPKTLADATVVLCVLDHTSTGRERELPVDGPASITNGTELLLNEWRRAITNHARVICNDIHVPQSANS